MKIDADNKLYRLTNTRKNTPYALALEPLDVIKILQHPELTTWFFSMFQLARNLCQLLQ